MISFIDPKQNRFNALTEYQVSHGVNGEKSLSGTIFTNDEVLQQIDRGWRLEVEGEIYVITFAVPKDYGNVIETEFDAVHEFFYDFAHDVVYHEMNGSNTFDAYMRFIFQDSGYSYTNETTARALERENFGNENRLSLFNKIIRDSGVEFNVSGRVVRIINRVGTDLTTKVEKSFNMNELRLEKNINDFVTYMRGYGAWNDDEDHSQGRLEVEYESPLATEYGRLHAEPVIDERYTVESNLYDRLKAHIDNSYTISVQLDMEDLTRAGYDYEQPRTGDWIMAINRDLGFQQRIRIVNYTSHYDVYGNLIKHDVVCNSIGAVQRLESDSAGISTQIRDLQERADRTDLDVLNMIVSAQGTSRVFHGNIDPITQYEVRSGDMWFDNTYEQTVMKEWNGNEWITVVDPRDIGKNAELIAEAMNEVEESKQEVKEDIEQALADAKAHADAEVERINTKLSAEIGEAIDLAEEAKADAESKANQALEDARAHADSEIQASKESFDEQLGVISDEVSDAKSSADTANQQINDAINEAGFSTLADLTADIQSISNQAIENARESIEIAERADGYALEALDIVNGFGTRITDVESTVDGQVTSINTAIATAERVEQELTRVEETAEGARVIANRVEETAEGFERTISEVRGDLDSLSIGGRNILYNSNFSREFDEWYTGSGTVTTRIESDEDFSSYLSFEVSGTSGNSGILQSTRDDGRIKNGETYTLSLYLKSEEAQTVSIALDGSQTSNATNFITTPDWTKYTFTRTSSGGNNIFRIYHLGSTSAPIDVANIKLEKGNKATDWTPAPEDYETRFVSMEADIEGITTTVSDYEGRISRTEQRADGLYDVVHDPNTGLLTEVGQIAEGWQVTAQRIDDLSVGGRNLLSNSNFNVGTSGWNNWSSGGTFSLSGNEPDDRFPSLLYINNVSSSSNYVYKDLYASLEAGEDITISFYAKGSGTINGIRLGQTGGNAVSVTHATSTSVSSDWRRYTFTLTVNVSTESLSFYGIRWGVTVGEYWITNIQVEKGNKATDWTPAPEDMATQAQLSVLHNAIDLAVEEGDVIGRLNIQAGHTLIQNGEILMDADTVRFTGSAFIPNAAIEELHADKITAGTIDAARIDAKLIVTEGLEADVIEADHIKADTAIIEKLFATEAHIDVLTSKTAFIDSIRAVDINASRITSGTINSARINASQIVTQGLTANVIQSTHIETSTATIDKLFATTASVNTLTSKTAFIESIEAIDISADRITAGTIDANEINVINLNASSVTSGTFRGLRFISDFDIEISGIGYEGARIQGATTIEDGIIHMSGIETRDNQRVGFQIDSVALHGYMGDDWWELSSYGLHVQASDGTGVTTSAYGSFFRYRNLGVIAGLQAAPFLNDANTIGFAIETHSGGRMAEIGQSFNILGNLNMRGNYIERVNRVSLEQANGGYLIGDNSNSVALLNSSGNTIKFGIGSPSSWHARMEIGGNVNYYTNLNMRGNNVSNVGNLSYNSDERLKEVVSKYEGSSLEKIKTLDFVNYYWLDRDYNDELQMGLLAQQSDCISNYDEEDDRWNIDVHKQLMLVTHGLQELTVMEEETNKLASKNYLKIEELTEWKDEKDKKIEELEARIKELEGVS